MTLLFPKPPFHPWHLAISCENEDSYVEHISDVLSGGMLLQIGVKGAEIFAECLQYNATITTLDLRANSLGDDVCYHS